MLLRYLGVDFKDVVRAADAKRQQSTQCKEFVDSVERNTEASLRSDTLLQHYEQGPGPEFSREAWLKVREARTHTWQYFFLTSRRQRSVLGG